MINFLNFIEEDIEAKKTLFSTMPTKTKSNKKKYNEQVDLIIEKYEKYKIGVKKYLEMKSKSFEIKDSNKNLEKLNKKVTDLEHVRFVLNPLNTYVEKMGFDNLLYEMSNYYDLNFSSLNEIIDQFLNKFKLANIELKSSDFDYTFYVNEYMTSFLEVHNSKSKNYNEVSKIFEKIYWVNPEIIQHIELNFRKLIKKYEKKFEEYISNLQKKVMSENDIKDYDDCLDKLKIVYNDLVIADREDIADIIELAKNGSININNYFEDCKFRTTAYSNLSIDSLNLEDKIAMDKFYENLENLRVNIEEYNNYIKFMPIIKVFKEEYESQIPTDSKEKSINKYKSFSMGKEKISLIEKDLKEVELQINNKESKLEKTNSQIFSGKVGLFKSSNDSALKQLKMDSIKQAKELYELYKSYDKEYFKSKVLSVLNSYMTISDVLHLYYSFDYFKKIALKKVFEITSYEDIIKYSEEFDLFAMNLANVIIEGLALFGETDINKNIINKYRLYNINLNDETLNPNDLESLLEKVQYLLRIDKIEKSSTTVEKIWFMTQVEKINKTENKNK
jgi:hypothetical protein